MASGNIETSNRILRAAKSEFAEKGFEGARMGAIAKRAEANQALIHYYFGSKENLYTEILKRMFGADPSNIKPFQKLIEKWELDPYQNLYVTIYMLVYIHLEGLDIDFHRIISREVAEGHRFLFPLLKDYLVPRILHIEDNIKKGIEQGLFDVEEPIFVVLQIITFISSYAVNKDIYKNTGLYDRLYNGYDTEKFFNTVFSQFAKMLFPVNTSIYTPEIPQEVWTDIEKFKNEMTKDIFWNSSDNSDNDKNKIS